MPPPDAGRATGGVSSGVDAAEGGAPPADDLLPAERWLIENRPRLAAIADQARGGGVGGGVGGSVGGGVGGCDGGGFGGDAGMASPPRGYPPPYLTMADGAAPPSLGPGYAVPSSHVPSSLEPSDRQPTHLGPSHLDPSCHELSHLGPSYGSLEPSRHEPREGWVLDLSGEPATQLEVLSLTLTLSLPLTRLWPRKRPWQTRPRSLQRRRAEA